MRFIAKLMLLVTLMALMSVIDLHQAAPSSAATGDVLRSTPLNTKFNASAATGVLTHLDGSVSVVACKDGSTGSFSFASTYNGSGFGTSTVNDDSTLPDPCPDYSAAGTNGELYFVRFGMTHPQLVMQENGEVIATHIFSQHCPNPNSDIWGTPRNMQIGSDGNLYTIIDYGAQCSYPNQLVSIDHLTGAVRFTTTLTTHTYGYSGASYLQPYIGGVVVLDRMRTAYADGDDRLLYINNDGTISSSSCSPFLATGGCGFSLSSGEMVEELFVDELGTVYIGTSRYDYANSPCGIIRRVLKYSPSGTGNASVLPNPSACTVGNTYLAGIMPNGNLVFNENVSDNSNALVSVWNQQGTQLYSGWKWHRGGSTYTSAPYMSPVTIDGTGQPVVETKLYKLGNTTADVYVERLTTSGAWETLYTSAGKASTANYRVAAYTQNFAFAKDAMYIALCLDNCSSGSKSLYKIDVHGEDIEYPRNAVLSGFAASRPALNYVAIGDSFSSGEGNPPFTEGTTDSPGDTCHRSEAAYANLLNNDASTNLNLVGFRACSGATTNDVMNGSKGESSQLNWIDSTTDVVTVTAGGNDVGFSTYATACFMGVDGCGAGSQPYVDFEDNLNASAFASSLLDLYDAVGDRLRNTGTKVYVLGYPHVLESSSGGSSCQLGSISPSDAQGAAEVVDEINTVISDVVDSLSDARFVYINPNASGSPFAGHDMCSSDPYFNGANVLHQEYTAHPNVEGHMAYEELIKAALL